MTKIKICGLSRPVDIDYVNEAVPDYIGFVFARSRRQVSEEQAGDLKSRLKPEIKTVGVFVNEQPDKIIRLCKNQMIDIVQLHGDEDDTYIDNLKKQITNSIMKAVRVKNQENIEAAVTTNCDYLLLDAYHEDQYGGSGNCFDWSLINKINKPFFLAGGIHPDNVLQAIMQVNPYAVDVSSGVETGGFKDRDKIIDMIKKVRSVK